MSWTRFISWRAAFQHMLDVALAADAREPGYFDFAVQFRQEASQALRDVMALSA